MFASIIQLSGRGRQILLRRVVSSSTERFSPRGARSQDDGVREISASSGNASSKPDTRADYDYIRDQIRAVKTHRYNQGMPVAVALDELSQRLITDDDYLNGTPADVSVQFNTQRNKKSDSSAVQKTSSKSKIQSDTASLRTVRRPNLDHESAEVEDNSDPNLSIKDADAVSNTSSRQDNSLSSYPKEVKGPISVHDIPQILQRLDQELRSFDALKVRPKLQPRGNLAAYVNDSETLQKLVHLGVRLHEVERIPGAANLLVKLNYAVDVEPFLQLLRERIAVHSNKELAEILTGFPKIFRVPFREIDELITYLESKRFTKGDIAKLVVREPMLLSLNVKQLDAKLGALQKEFSLTGDQLRAIVNEKPKLLLRVFKHVRDMHVTTAKYLGFQKSEVKQIVTNAPGILLADRDLVLRNFDYLHNTMKLDHPYILKWPKALHADGETLRNRHLFLMHLGKAQYDPKAPCFVSLAALLDNTDQQFCAKVAETDLQVYRNFLRTL